VLDRDGVEKKEVTAPNEGAAVRLEGLEFPYEGKAFVRVATQKFVKEDLESQYSLELSRSGGQAAPTAAPASSTPAGAPAPQVPAGASGLPMMWIGLGVVAVALLVGVAYRLGRGSSPRH
jgi:hypothetical protein